MKRKKFGAKIIGLISALIIIAIGGAIAAAMQIGVDRMPIRKYFSVDRVNAIWDWKNPTTYRDSELSELANDLYMHQINTIYLDIGLYVGIAQQPDSPDKDAKTTELRESITRYLTAMNRRGIRVFAAAGHTDWSKPAQQSIPLSVQKFVFDFNQGSDVKLAGMEFDIESYNQTGFPEASFTEKELVLTEFLDMVHKLATEHEKYIQETNQQDFELGFAIPYWFDNENGNIKSVSWQDKEGPTLYHLLDRLNKLPRSNVVVMAYRNAAVGNDGMIFHSRTEIDYARSKAPNVAIILGIEVNDVEPAKITFYGSTYVELSSQAKLLDEEFGASGVYKGTAINDLTGYQEMADNEDPL